MMLTFGQYALTTGGVGALVLLVYGVRVVRGLGRGAALPSPSSGTIPRRLGRWPRPRQRSPARGRGSAFDLVAEEPFVAYPLSGGSGGR
jgi:hypothetical protein